MAVKKPKKVMSKSVAAKKARAGVNLGSKKVKGFSKIVNATKGKYGVKTAKKIAGAKFQMMRKKGML